MKPAFPSIWLGDFHSKSEFDQTFQQLPQTANVFDWIDDRLLFSRHPFSYPAYCAACEQVTKVRLDWMFGGWGNLTASIHPAWTETGVCESCGLNSRMRALMDFVKHRIDRTSIQQAYIAEEITPMYRKLKKLFPLLTGSEFVAPNLPPGQKVRHGGMFRRIRHEDLTNLSFASNTMDLMITLDVFEHIPNFRKAFREAHRILTPRGQLAFTIPFFFDAETTRIRASLDENGTVVHHLPAEIHGNPLSNEGSLCFQNFGWDILSELKNAGFSESKACLYWGPWQGHLGFPFFVFSAVKF